MPVDAHSQIFALLADMHLLTARQDGAILADTSLDPRAPINTVRATGHYLALGTENQHVYVLVPRQPQALDLVVAVNAVSAHIESTYTLPGGDYHSITVGAQTGQLFVFGDRGSSAIVTVIDPANGANASTWTARSEDGHAWTVYQGSVSADQRRIYVSYHGTDTTGLDWFDVTPDGLVRCLSAEPANFGCIASHGAFAVLPNELLVATGGPMILDVDATGVVRRAFDTGLQGNHLMEFVADPAAERLYAVGSCGYSGGFSAASLRRPGIPTTPTIPGEWSWAIAPQPPQVLLKTQPCGERLSLGSAGLVVGKTAQPVAQPARHGALLMVDPSSGRLTWQIETASEPLDVLALPPIF